MPGFFHDGQRRVFDRTISLDEVPAAYQDMADRRVLKALITF
ncbi:hypothetical protein [Streptomyces sp. NPDC056452]